MIMFYIRKRLSARAFPYIYLGEASLKKNEKIWGKFPKGGEDVKEKKFPISIWEFGKPRGGLNFSKMSELQ